MAQPIRRSIMHRHRETQLLLEIPHLPLIIMQKPLLVMLPYSVGWSQ
jgi:hypothetical protein